jgi:hypothetical protein
MITQCQCRAPDWPSNRGLPSRTAMRAMSFATWTMRIVFGLRYPVEPTHEGGVGEETRTEGRGDSWQCHHVTDQVAMHRRSSSCIFRVSCFSLFFFPRAPVAIDSLFFLLSENLLQEHRTDGKPNLDLCPCSVPLSVVLPQVYSITLQFHCLRISNIQHPSVGARGQN